MLYTTSQLADITQSEVRGDKNLTVSHLAYDSRAIFSTENTAFIALNTERKSGENYIRDAVEKGIKIIISTSITEDLEDLTWIITNDTTAFLRRLAKHHLETLSGLKTIGITGSNGKTIVKEWLYQSISPEHQTVKSPKSFNSQIGLPLSILQVNAEHEIGIFEVGISKPGEMSLQQEIFQPHIGIFTHLGSAHMANFDSPEHLLREKIALFKNTKTIIFNGDDDLVYSLISNELKDKNLISFGQNARNSVLLAPLDKKRGDFEIRLIKESFKINLPNHDEATLSNTLCVAAALEFLGYGAETISAKLSHLKSVEMRLESVSGLRNNLIINDSYNLDIDSLKIAFQFIKEYRKRDKILIISDFGDLKDPDKQYPQIIRLINQQNFSKVILLGDEITQYSSIISSDYQIFNSTDDLLSSHWMHSVENSLILIKGARKFETDRISTALELQKHDTVLEVNLNSLLHNINVHKSYLKGRTKIMAMVKAFAYGTGGFEIAEFLQHHHIDYLGVAYADEGVDLRKNGITIPIMVMNPEQHSYDSIIDYNLEPEIYSFRVLERFRERLVAKGVAEPYPIHIKLETGMHRLGFSEEMLEDLIAALKDPKFKVKSIFSHLATADMPQEKDFTLQQLKDFEKSSARLIETLGYPVLRHVLNSSGITNFPDYQYDMVRIGIGMYGISGDKTVKKKLQSVVTFKTVISQISSLQPDQSVGYGRRFKASENLRIATLPVGYADGIPRSIGNGVGHVNIGGKLCPIVGSVCMDMLMVNIEQTTAQEGDEVVIFNGNPSLEKFAEYSNTIPYEVLTSISRRVKRIYIKN